MSLIAKTPTAPYYTVIFSSERSSVDNGYAKMAERMLELAAAQPGYLGVESARDDLGITVSYWSDLESIRRWKQNTEHLSAQKSGRSQWYAEFKVRVARVERDYGFSAK